MGGDTSDDKMTGRIARERNHFPFWAALFLIFGIHVPLFTGLAEPSWHQMDRQIGNRHEEVKK